MNMQFTDTSEKGFQKYIAKYLTEHHDYTETLSNDFDREFCLNTKQLLAFIEKTQPQVFEMIQKKSEKAFLLRLDGKIKELGVIEVLRKGVKHFDKTIVLFYRKPATKFNPKELAKYKANQFSITQELKIQLGK